MQLSDLGLHSFQNSKPERTSSLHKSHSLGHSVVAMKMKEDTCFTPPDATAPSTFPIKDNQSLLWKFPNVH